MTLLEIRDTARAMGLEADGVQLGAIDQLGELLSKPKSSVVIATALGPPERQFGHFLCTVGSSAEHFIVIDPPRPVHLMSVDNMARAMARGKGYALVVRPKE